MKQSFKWLLLAVLIAIPAFAAIAQDSFTQEEKKLIKLYKKYNSHVELGLLYLDKGMIEAATEELKGPIGANRCYECREKIDEAIWQKQFPKEVNDRYKEAVQKLKYGNSTKEGINILRSLVEIDKYPAAAYQLAELHKKGDVSWPTKYMDSAIIYAEFAAFAGYVPAMHQLAKFYQYSDGFPLEEPSKPNQHLINLTKAKYWYRQASEKEYQQAFEMDSLFRLYDANPRLWERAMQAYTDSNFLVAKQWWTVLAKAERNAAAAYNVGILYYNRLLGKTKYNFEKATDWFKMAGSLGMADGFFMFAKMEWEDIGFGSTAMEYYQKAADLGHPQALEKKKEIEKYVAAVIADRQASSERYSQQVKMQSVGGSSSFNSGNNGQSRKSTTTCSTCHGSGRVHITIYGGAKTTSGSVVFGEYRTCTTCNGRGYY